MNFYCVCVCVYIYIFIVVDYFIERDSSLPWVLIDAEIFRAHELGTYVKHTQ